MMRPLPNLILAVCVVLGPVAAGRRWPALAQAPAQNAPMTVLSDTPEYCVQLEMRVQALPNRTQEVRRLEHEGHQLCDHGQVRLGIAHLRHALMMMKHPVLVAQPQ